MRTATPLDREILRKAVLRYLVYYHPSAFDSEMVRRAVRDRRYVDWLPEPEEMRSVLALLSDLGLIAQVETEGDRRVALGATSYWGATAKGVLEQEREIA